MRHTQTSTTQTLLGYPRDARLLLVNAVDFGMYPAINEAVVRSYHEGIVRSTSLMVPCPGASQAINLLKENPDIRFGVHLSVIRDIDGYVWGALAPREQVPSLLDGDGRFYVLARMAEFLERARLDELEREFRVQIEAVLSEGLQPTHLDWHCLHSGGRADVFAMTMELALEYGLALRVASQPYIDRVQRQGFPTADHELMDSFALRLEDKSNRYAAMLRDLPVGLTEWAVHPSIGDAASQAIDADGWRVRQTDFEFVMSAEAREIIAEEGITLIGYEPLQAVWRTGPSGARAR